MSWLRGLRGPEFTHVLVQKERPVWLRYGLSLATVAASVFISIWTHPLSERAPFLFYVPAVLFAVWYGGFGPGLCVSVLSAACVNYFTFHPHKQLKFDPDSLILTVLFTAMFTVLSALTSNARKNLHATLGTMSQLLEGSTDPVIVRDAADKIVYWNSGAANLYGWQKDEALGRDFNELLRPQLPVPLEQIYKELDKSGRWYAEVTHYRKDGSCVIVETSWTAKADPSKPRLILQTDVDLAVKRMAEQSRRISQVRERMATEAAGIGLWDWDLSNDRLLCSNNGLKMFGLAPGTEGTYKTYLELVHPEDREAVDAAVHDALKGRTDYRMEYRTLRPDGSVRWIAAAGRGFYRADSQAAEFMCGVLVDITKQREYELELRLLSERLEFVLETAEIGEWELDPVTHEVSTSSRHDQIFGYEGRVADWSSERFLEHVVEEDRPRVANKIRTAIKTSSPWQIQTQIRRKDGQLRWVWVRARVWNSTVDNRSRVLGTVLDVNEQRERERELQVAHSRLIEAYSVAKMWPWKFDAETETIHYDVDLMPPFGRESKPQASLDDLAEQTYADDREAFLHYMRESGAGGAPVEAEFRRLHPDGRYHWVLMRSRALVQHGKSFLVGSSIDIDEIKRTQEESEKNRRLLEKFVEHAPVGLVMLDRKLRQVQASEHYCAARGIDRKATMGKVQNEIFPNLPEDFREAQRRGLSGDHLIFPEERMTWVDGTEHWVRVEIVPWGDSGEETGGIIIFSEDITAQHQAEAELKRLNRAMSALSKSNKALIRANNEQELVQAVVDTAAKECGYELAWVGMPEDDEAKTVRVVARAGAAVDYLNGAKVTWDENDPSGRGPTGTCLRTGSVLPVKINDPMFAPWRERARSYRIAAILNLPLISDGKILGALALYSKDDASFDLPEIALMEELAGDLAYGITTLRAREAAKLETKQRVQLEEQFRQAQKMEAVGQLAGGVAHDFNNLLMVIMSQAEMLLELVKDQNLVPRLKDIVDASDRCAELTRQLLAFSRKQVLQPSVVSLNTIVRDTTRLLKNAIREDIDVQFSLADDLRPVKIDRIQMLQVIMNLVINARDAMPEGGRLILETYNREADADYVNTHPAILPGNYSVLAVTDTGTGMDAETQARIFEPFFTTKLPGKGTGMGLSTVYGIVKQSGGFIWVYSEVGKGTTFKIYLPWSEEGSVPTRATKLSKPPKETTSVVLLVEDDAGLRRVIKGFLAGAGHHVIEADSVAAAMAIAQESSGQIDVLLTDVILSGGNGRELAEALREKGFNFHVVFMSGYTADAITQHGVLEPGIHFLQKPFSKTVLLDMIEKILA